MIDEIQRIYYTPKEAAKHIGVRVAELHRRVKLLRVPVRHKGTSYKIHIDNLNKIAAYRETIEAENKRLQIEVQRLKRIINTIKETI